MKVCTLGLCSSQLYHEQGERLALLSELRDGASQDKRRLSFRRPLSAGEHTQSTLRAVSLAHKEAVDTPGVPTGQRDLVEFLGSTLQEEGVWAPPQREQQAAGAVWQSIDALRVNALLLVCIFITRPPVINGDIMPTEKTKGPQKYLHSSIIKTRS